MLHTSSFARKGRGKANISQRDQRENNGIKSNEAISLQTQYPDINRHKQIDCGDGIGPAKIVGDDVALQHED